MYYASKVDGNQAEIVDDLRSGGWWVLPTNRMRGKLLDLIACKHAVTVFVECKMPGETLTDSEKKFMAECPGLKVIAYGGQDALDKCGAMLEHWR